MGIISEIRNAVFGMMKHAQAPGFTPTPLYSSSMMPSGTMRDSVQKDWALGSKMDSMHHSNNVAMLRGYGKALKEAVPGFIDVTSGNIAGLIAGAGSKLSGGKFSDGFHGAKEEVRKLTDPIRNAEMALGGSKIRDTMGSVQKYHLNNIASKSGPLKDNNGNLTSDGKVMADHIDGLGDIEGVSEVAGSIAAQWPLWGGAARGAAGLKPMMKWLFKGKPASAPKNISGFGKFMRSNTGAQLASVPMTNIEPIGNYLSSVEDLNEYNRRVSDARKLYEQTTIGPWRDDAAYEQASRAMDMVADSDWRDNPDSMERGLAILDPSQVKQNGNDDHITGWSQFL